MQLPGGHSVAALGRGRDPRVVGDDDDRRAGAVDLAKYLEDALGRRCVEVAGRLVGEQQIGLGGERASNRRALLLAARELVGQVGEYAASA